MWGAVYWTAENVTECKCEIEKMEETKMEQVCIYPEIYIQSAPNNSNESYAFMGLGRVGRFGQS